MNLLRNIKTPNYLQFHPLALILSFCFTMTVLISGDGAYYHSAKPFNLFENFK